ncbi:MAG: DNA polymerase I [Alphaproteobacteria bacterium]
MSEKFFLIDGSSFLFRAFFGVPLRFRTDGTPVNAVYGFCNMLLTLIEEKQHGRYAVILDSGGKTFRHDLYSDYKANRPPLPEEIKPQFDIMKEAIEAFGIPALSKKGFEADDLLATYAKQADQNGYILEIISSDKDLMQLISPNVFMYDTMKNKIYKEKDVFEKQGVFPTQMIDFQAIVGDSSDNVPGVKGVGKVGASKLLAEYKTLDGIYENIEKITKKAMKEKLIRDKDTAYLSKKLVTLDQDVPEIPNIDFIKPAEINLQKLGEFFEKNQFYRLHTRLDSFTRNTKEDYIILKTKNQQELFLQRIFDAGEVGIIVSDFTIALSVTEQVGIITFGENTDLFSEKKEATPPEFFYDLLENRMVKKVVKNLKSFSKKFPKIKKAVCLETMNYVVFGAGENKNKTSIKAELFSSKHSKENFEAKQLLKEYQRVKGFLEDDKVASELYNKIDFPLIEILENMEKNGITIDQNLLEKIGNNLGSKIEKLDEEILKTIPENVNLDSPKQLGIFLFEDLKLEYSGKKTASGQYSTDSSKLKNYKDSHEVISLLLERREYVKLKSTYVEGLKKTIQNDGKIHTTFEQNYVNTGRLSSRNPNLQNIPIRTEIGKEFRKIFIPQQSWDLIASDYSQIELRVMAHLAGVKNLVSAFKNDRDIHTETAGKIFGISQDQVSKSQRRKAKIINFSIIYGATHYGLAESLQVDLATAKSFMTAYFSLFPEIKKYAIEKYEEAKDRGFVQTLFGRKCFVAQSQHDENFAKRVAINAPVQGTSADIMRLAMVNVYKKLKQENLETRMLLQIHDEIILESPKNETEKVLKILKETMENVVELSVPLKIDSNVGINWNEAH